MAERFPRRVLTVPLTPDAIYVEATVPPPDPAWMQPTVRGPMPVPPQPSPVPTATYLAPQASVWPGGPGVWGQAAQLPPGGLPPTPAQLPPGGLTPAAGLHLPVLLLLPGGLHPAVAPPTAPAPCSGHPLLAGTLLPQQPMGLWPGAVLLHEEPPQPAGTCLPQAP
ncbi:wiskott-Aldrich syndrome protein family member 1-like, partial [Phasianus colchicus]|uniref:wiskott-Aldrich syndrome protein family member 1-like n=1 Tax=Phasianus colchicus TaxID=9054 RepID=UPI00129DDC94